MSLSKLTIMVLLRYTWVTLVGFTHHTSGSTPQIEKRLDNGVGKTPAMGWNNWNMGGGSSKAHSYFLSSPKYRVVDPSFQLRQQHMPSQPRNHSSVLGWIKWAIHMSTLTIAGLQCPETRLGIWSRIQTSGQTASRVWRMRSTAWD